jgi:hypothetical protein
MSLSRVVLVLTVTGAMLVPIAASAQPRHDERGRPQAQHYEQHGPPAGYYGHNDNSGAVVAGALLGLGLGAVIGGALAAPPVYAPPPVYYAPPPTYYAPPPAVYYGY